MVLPRQRRGLLLVLPRTPPSPGYCSANAEIYLPDSADPETRPRIPPQKRGYTGEADQPQQHQKVCPADARFYPNDRLEHIKAHWLHRKRGVLPNSQSAVKSPNLITPNTRGSPDAESVPIRRAHNHPAPAGLPRQNVLPVSWKSDLPPQSRGSSTAGGHLVTQPTISQATAGLSRPHGPPASLPPGLRRNSGGPPRSGSKIKTAA